MKSTFIWIGLSTLCQIKLIIHISRVNMEMIMPYVLIASRLIMLTRRNPITTIYAFHCKSCKLSRMVNFNSVNRREFKDVLKMLIRNNQNMSFIVRPPFFSYKCGYIFILINDISLFSSHVNRAEWAFISFRLVRISLHFSYS